MRVQILFFGQLKEVAGRERDTLELPEGARVAYLLRRYAELKPALQPYYDAMAVALNQEYSEAGAPLHEGDEVALIPPVSGGSGKEREPSSQRSTCSGIPEKQQDASTLHARSFRPEGPRDDALLRRATAGAPARATKIEIVWQRIDSQAVVEGIKRPEDGAVAVFEGIVRNHSRNRRTLYLDYEAYEPMALKKLEELAEQAR